MSNRLFLKLAVTFLVLLSAVGVCNILITFYYTNHYLDETTQRLNAKLAEHLIDEKFKQEKPFFEDGSVNKPLFGDIMHDMMAVNRAIEVYLVDENGGVLYSVVLDHDSGQEPMRTIDLAPVRTFIETEGNVFVLGDNPKNASEKKIFSAAHFVDGEQGGYIYIILEGGVFDTVSSGLFGSYFTRLTSTWLIVTLSFAVIIGLIAIWYLTRNIRAIITTMAKFKNGDTQARIADTSTDLSVIASTFNDMADTIDNNIDKLKSLDRLRQELVANVSHDLRTPLTVIQGYVETLIMKAGTLTDAEREKYYGVIYSSSERLSKLVHELFEYSKLEARQVEPVMEAFQISELVNDVVAKYSLIAEGKGITLMIEGTAELPLVYADIGMVERVLQNLIDNALKHTPRGGVVSVTTIGGEQSVEFIIKDSGAGIAEEDLSFIFDRYQRSTPQEQRHASGTGLGLAIVKKIMEIHHSKITVKSRLNEGTAFNFWLPVYAKQMQLT
jgi:signal transduction histidine kinase